MLKQILPFHYLTQDLAVRTHEEQAILACKAGVKWVQLRMKEKPEETCLAIARNVKTITDQFGATLIINDFPVIAKEINADGVHLGQDDTNCAEARKILGTEKIIGLSAHNIHELQLALDADSDYVGIGPFRFTSTKKNLDEVLGLEGIKNLVSHSRSSPHKKPLIAIGGIRLNDVSSLFGAGVNGIAVSSAINFHKNPSEEINRFLTLLEISNLKPETI